MRRRDFVAGIVGSAAWPLAAPAQQPAMPVIGFLHPESLTAMREDAAAFHRGLAATGFIEGRNVALEYRWAEGQNDRLPALALELVRREVALIVALGTPATIAAKAATNRIPIVFQVGVDPREFGFVASLNRPGGNLTGVAELNVDVTAKCFEVLHELLPSAPSIAFLGNPAHPANRATVRELQAAARTLGVGLLEVNASSASEIETAFEKLVAQRAGALVVSPNSLYFERRHQLTALAARNALPAIYFDRVFVEAGGLLSYGTNLFDSLRQVGSYAGRILKGDKPADLPVQQATKIELVINMKAAKALDIVFPLTLLGRADEVIE
jgi:putative ABC transport system substrate-binding protein